jgi:TonB family protein
MRLTLAVFLLTAMGAFAQQPFHLGPGVIAPFVASRSKPEYTDEARLAKLEGSVQLSLVVAADGSMRDIQITRPLGLGLDDKAIDCLRSWQFRPGAKDGLPADIFVNEEVFFRPPRTLWDWHTVRVVFESPPNASRPVLIKTKFPATVEEEENAAVTIAFDIPASGIPANIRVAKSSDAKWNTEVVAAVRSGWRFHPAVIDGKPVTTPAWFEFVRGSHSPIPPVRIP